MRIEDQRGEPVNEATVTVDEAELIDLLQGLADVIEDKRPHLPFAQQGGPQLVVRRTSDDAADPLRRQTDWWLGPLVLLGALFVLIGAITVVRWAIGLAT
jgi:hypothetical protein